MEEGNDGIKRLLRVASCELKEKEIMEYWNDGRMEEPKSCELRVTR